ncbi:hypothetical protein Tco_1457960 [Tanacetum coccineum]
MALTPYARRQIHDRLSDNRRSTSRSASSLVAVPKLGMRSNYQIYGFAYNRFPLYCGQQECHSSFCCNYGETLGLNHSTSDIVSSGNKWKKEC